MKYLYVAMAFITAFLMGSWALRGFPTTKEPKTIVREDRSAKFAARAAEIRKAKVHETAESSRNQELNEIRRTTISAANIYAAVPCNSDHKARLVKALTTYVNAYLAKRGCTIPVFCNDSDMELSAAAFSTPLDAEVGRALRSAFSQGGIGSDDFPFGTQMAVRHFTWGANGEQALSCQPGRR